MLAGCMVFVTPVPDVYIGKILNLDTGVNNGEKNGK